MIMSAEHQYHAALAAYSAGKLRTVAQDCMNALRDEGLSAALTVRIIYLHLRATELWWELDPTEDVSRLVARAQDAATHTDDPALIALAQCLYGRYLIATEGLTPAVPVFSKAAALATESRDPLAKLDALSDLGHHGVGQDLGRGMSILWQAQALAEQLADADVAEYDRPLILASKARLQGLLGVAIFDEGRFADAEMWLQRSLDSLEVIKAWDQVAVISNYLGQLLTNMGRFEEAERLLITALGPLRTDADLSTFQGYNLGLLGKLYIEWDRVQDADASLTAGWIRLQRTRHRSILPLLRNYRGELIIHPSFHASDLKIACALFGETIEECRRTGFLRSEIAALSLLARTHLALGNTADALTASTGATQKLEAAGTMPALRSEEIYFTHWQALNAVGDKSAASHYLVLAQDVLRSKAVTIEEPGLREQFLSRVPISAAILNAG
jgi:tetratricopeptide (TPR) repeat protein